jgi:hypothetical protein
LTKYLEVDVADFVDSLVDVDSVPGSGFGRTAVDVNNVLGSGFVARSSAAAGSTSASTLATVDVRCR